YLDIRREMYPKSAVTKEAAETEVDLLHAYNFLAHVVVKSKDMWFLRSPLVLLSGESLLVWMAHLNEKLPKPGGVPVLQSRTPPAPRLQKRIRAAVLNDLVGL